MSAQPTIHKSGAELPYISERSHAMFQLASKLEQKGLRELAWEVAVCAANCAIDDYPVHFEPRRGR